MNIQYYGDYCFKITTKPNGRATEDVVIVTDVPDKGLGLRAPQGEAGILLLSHQSPDAVGLEVIKGSPVKIFSPGEYSARGISILGFPSVSKESMSPKAAKNTIFLFETEEMRLCFLGGLAGEPAADVIERLTGVDVLFIPVGGGDTLPIDVIDELVRKIEPKTVIPMHYKIAGMTTALPDEKSFCKVMGNCPRETIAKWNVKKKDLEGKNMEIVLLAKN
ncbi:MAG: hypothetical protein E6Q06_03965 [Candidatus Moraniibacteriota bacterium]|nr:MAG: hypothetical protein E6Q06_03965 [Candidatus Moranbacteria bacterium]